MAPEFPTGRLPGTSRVLALVALGFALVVGACGGSSPPSFDPDAPCGVDGRAPGAYPELEARLPATLDDAPPTGLDSGRHCSEGALGSLIAHDTAGIRFAGATWDRGGGDAITSAIFGLVDRDLPASWIAEFYEIGARTAKRTEQIETSRPVFEGVGETFRLDTLNGLSLQSVVVWQDGPLVRAVLAATAVAPDASRTAHDTLVELAVASAASVGSSAAAPVPAAAASTEASASATW